MVEGEEGLWKELPAWVPEGDDGGLGYTRTTLESGGVMAVVPVV